MWNFTLSPFFFFGRYKKLSEKWRESKPPPKTPEEASRLIIQTLKRHQKADVEVLALTSLFSAQLIQYVFFRYLINSVFWMILMNIRVYWPFMVSLFLIHWLNFLPEYHNHGQKDSNSNCRPSQWEPFNLIAFVKFVFSFSFCVFVQVWWKYIHIN